MFTDGCKMFTENTFEDMWPKFINTVLADALGLNATRLYADTVLTLIGVFVQCLLMTVLCKMFTENHIRRYVA